ncbi:MAG: redoxin family protein [Planctomycetes bacterium]|nr:redoxin family protein [Planctomycetota bacterium]
MKTPKLWWCLLPLAAAGGCKFLVKQLVDHTEFWPNGLVKARVQLRGDKQDGEATLSYESGRPLAKGFYKDDRQVGDWIFYYENGNEMRSGRYDDAGLRTGEWIYKYEDQTPQSRGSYVGDFEDGPWTFYGPDGAVSMAGAYDAGKQSGLWHFHYAAGRPKAEGIYHRGDRVGPWQVWSESGKSRVQDFGKKAGIVLVRELWDGTDVLRRVGVVENGKPVGRWATWHQNGKSRLEVGLKDGAPHGVFVARDEAGDVIAQGVVEAGQVKPGAIVVQKGVSRPMAAGPLPAAPAAAEPWAALTAWVDVAVEQQVATMVAEAQAAVGDQPFAALVLRDSEQPTAGEPAPAAAAVLAQVDEGPMRQPAAAQPGFTIPQKEKLQKIVSEYENGPQAGGTSLFANYAPTAGSLRPASGTGRRLGLEGKPLPFTVMKGVDGNDVDLTTYRGKRRVMIVVLRGFLGEVCIYCVAQTKALAKARAKLEAANVEVLVIYPGARENEESFRRLYEEEFGEGPPPYRVFYDPDLELVTKLGIKGDLASPTTLIVDEQGVVQYAYVGEHRADRPATKKLLEVIEGIGK